MSNNKNIVKRSVINTMEFYATVKWVNESCKDTLISLQKSCKRKSKLQKVNLSCYVGNF